MRSYQQQHENEALVGRMSFNRNEIRSLKWQIFALIFHFLHYYITTDSVLRDMTHRGSHTMSDFCPPAARPVTVKSSPLRLAAALPPLALSLVALEAPRENCIAPVPWTLNWSNAIPFAPLNPAIMTGVSG